jgi:molybdopterin molybdotransferase
VSDHRPAATPDVVARTVEEHRAAVLAGAAPLPAVERSVPDAVGLVLAEAVAAGVDLPAFDNAAMDGYALHADDLAPDGPLRLPVVDDVAAGAAPRVAVGPGQAARVMTGAPVPAGTAAVVPVEWTDAGAADVRVDRRPAPGAHLRRAGEDVARGSVVLRPGAVVTPAVVGLLAAVGRTAVRVHPRPRVVVLSTGAELVPAGRRLGPAQIHDANGPMLAASAAAAGADVVTAPAVTDQPGALAAALAPHLRDADLVITSAGVSEGAYDVVKADLAGAGVQFARVAVQPGRPQGFGRVGPRAVPVVTLPGNPASAFVSFHVFVLPLLRRLLGVPDADRTLVATLAEPLVSPAGRRQFPRARLHRDPAGALVARPVGGPGSHLLGALARSDALLVVPEHVVALAAGAAVTVLLTGDAPPAPGGATA